MYYYFFLLLANRLLVVYYIRGGDYTIRPHQMRAEMIDADSGAPLYGLTEWDMVCPSRCSQFHMPYIALCSASLPGDVRVDGMRTSTNVSLDQTNATEPMSGFDRIDKIGPVTRWRYREPQAVDGRKEELGRFLLCVSDSNGPKLDIYTLICDDHDCTIVVDENTVRVVDPAVSYERVLATLRGVDDWKNGNPKRPAGWGFSVGHINSSVFDASRGVLFVMDRLRPPTALLLT